jgi:dsDNA-specific endonuclease/ATPase MutS2
MNIFCFLSVALRQAEERAKALATKLELSERVREKAEADAATVEDLRQRLANAENALSDKITQQSKREESIIARFDAQNRRFASKLLPFYLSSFS